MASTTNFALSHALLNAFAINDRINQYMIDHLPAEAWRADPPEGQGRQVAAIVAHMHNVRVIWLEAAAKGSPIPDPLDRHTRTLVPAKEGRVQGHDALRSVLKSALESDGRVKGFKPDVAAFQKAMFGMWEWGTR